MIMRGLILPVCICMITIFIFPVPARAQTDITLTEGKVSVQYNDSPAGENCDHLIDKNAYTKYLINHSSGMDRVSGINSIYRNEVHHNVRQ